MSQNKKAKFRHSNVGFTSLVDDLAIESGSNDAQNSDLASGADRSRLLESMVLEKKTKVAYEGHLKRLKTKFILNKRPEMLDEQGDFRVPMDLEHVKAIMGDLSMVREDKTVIAKATMAQYISAIKYLYKTKKVVMESSLTTYFSTVARGHAKEVAKRKQDGLMKQREGKVEFSMMVFTQLSRLALHASTISQSLSFSHLFCVFCWNLLARSINVQELRTSCILWEGDSMVIDFSRQKSDQAGERITPKHVFANPFLPEVCPILALGLHVFGISFRADRDDKTLLFEGTPYDSFTKWLHQALKKVSDLGYDAVDFGTHSFRKGAATHTSGFINGPSIISIFLRAGWSLGIVQDRYITQTQGGDQFLGRVACGLNFSMGSRFAVLPPSFRNSNVLTAEEWELICPGYSAHPVGFQATLPYLLASVVYHWDWLNASFHLLK